MHSHTEQTKTKKRLWEGEYFTQCPKETLFPVMSLYCQHSHSNTHTHASTQTRRDIPNMGFSFRNYPCNTHRKRISQSPFRFDKEEGETGCLIIQRVCWAGQVHSAERVGGVSWRATRRAHMFCKVELKYVAVMRGRPNNPIVLIRRRHHNCKIYCIRLFLPRVERKGFRFEFRHLEIFSSTNVSEKMTKQNWFTQPKTD